MSPDARGQVLGAIRRALGGDARGLPLPPPFALDLDRPSAEALVRTFCSELRALAGTAAVVQDDAECARAVEAYLMERGVKTVAVQSSPLARKIGSSLASCDVAQAADRSLLELERTDCGLIEGLALLADTGSALAVVTSREDRLLPYLPRTCVIVSRSACLHASLCDEALACIDEAARSGLRGEAVIITGPSRSADIEKTLVLGAHGPEALAVFLIA